MSSNQARNESWYWEEKPSPDLSSVAFRWCFSSDRMPAPPILILPDGGVSLLFSSPASGGDWTATAYGATTRATVAHHAECRNQVQLCFVPGAAPLLFGRDVAQFRDGAVQLRDLWGARADRLLAELSCAKSWNDRKHSIQKVWSEHPTTPEPASELLRTAIQLIGADDGRGPISQISARLSVNPRRLERVFLQQLGLSPKLFARIHRFRAARRALHPSLSLTQIALSFGFSDHAHMTREFRFFSGEEPSAIVASRLPSVEARLTDQSALLRQPSHPPTH